MFHVPCPMSNRIERVNQLIKEELSEIILREADFPKNILVTVVQVDSSVDLRVAKIYIGCLPEEKSENIMRILNRQIYDLQQKLNKRLNMRPIPRIKFIEEKKTKKSARIEELLEEIKNE